MAYEFRVNPAFVPWLDGKVERVMDAMGEFYADEVQRLMQTSPASGRVYRLRNPDRIHMASAPGEPPSQDTRELIHSIDSVGHGIGFDHVVEAGVTSTLAAEYAIPLELGTSRVLPRPAWIPALQNVRGIPRDLEGR